MGRGSTVLSRPVDPKVPGNGQLWRARRPGTNEAGDRSWGQKGDQSARGLASHVRTNPVECCL
jgi:hypothetical protein